jgi:ankyrin repeat protein
MKKLLSCLLLSIISYSNLFNSCNPGHTPNLNLVRVAPGASNPALTCNSTSESKVFTPKPGTLQPRTFNDPLAVALNTTEDTDLTDLMIAARNGERNLIKALIDSGANVHERDPNGLTAADHAADGYQLDALKILREAGAQIDHNRVMARRNQITEETRNLAKEFNAGTLAIKPNAQPLLVQQPDKRNFKSYFHNRLDTFLTLLQQPVSTNRTDKKIQRENNKPSITEIINDLHDKGVPLDNPDKDGQTPLMRAAHNGHAEAVEALLRIGANMNGRSEQGGCSPLFFALDGSQHKDDEARKRTIENLLNNGVNVNLSDKSGITPLMIAINYNNNDAINNLIAKGANLNAQDGEGRTALMHAVRNCNPETVKTLVTAGANLQIKGVNGRTALDYTILPKASKDSDDSYDRIFFEYRNIFNYNSEESENNCFKIRQFLNSLIKPRHVSKL